MERFFIIDKYNTWYDWHLLLTAKDTGTAEPNTNYVKLDGINGTLDLSESLSGEITYGDRTVSATFWTDYGNHTDRERLLSTITAAIHGKKVKLIEPDDPDHYFMGRVKIKSKKHNRAYLEFTIEATCEPWRHAAEETSRTIGVATALTKFVVIRNNGVKTICPTITVSGTVTLTWEGVETTLTDGTYKITDIKLRQGVTTIGVSGNGAVTLTYREGAI